MTLSPRTAVGSTPLRLDLAGNPRNRRRRTAFMHHLKEEIADEQGAGQGHDHGSGGPDRLRPAVPHRLRRDARTRHPRPAEPAGDHPGAEGGRGHRDGARRLRVPAAGRHRHQRRPAGRLRRHLGGAAGRCPPPRPGHGARRPVAGQRRHLQAAGRGHQCRCRGRCSGAGGRKPGQHQRLDRPDPRTGRTRRPVQRDDAAGPQPGADPGRQEARRRRSPTCTT